MVDPNPSIILGMFYVICTNFGTIYVRNFDRKINNNRLDTRI